VSAFERFLEEQLIDHSLRRAHHPQSGGKIEAVIATVQRELWEVVHCDAVADAERALGRFVDDYNHRRAHLGIGGLTPADRCFGRWPEVAADPDAVNRRRQGALAVQEQHRLTHELLPAQERALVLRARARRGPRRAALFRPAHRPRPRRPVAAPGRKPGAARRPLVAS
jgi:hypothetical protein